MKTFDFTPKGVCSRGIHLEIDDSNVVTTVKFTGGCSGNTQGVARLAEGRSVDEVIDVLKGIRCGMKDTSCPDQLACALEEFKKSL
ncbi:MAG: TIGR03905 family TSCPD domain-containing protein [Clostridia bacterium]|nr:TIGR03905 family TSCPD domain-containing protein [Clostridia bacterium]